MKLTARVAETIATALKANEFTVDSFLVKDLDKSFLKNYDCLIVGAPTMAFRASEGMRQFLDCLSRLDVSGKIVATFDTQVQAIISGNAAKEIEGKLKAIGCKPIAKPLTAFVQRKLRQNDGI